MLNRLTSLRGRAVALALAVAVGIVPATASAVPATLMPRVTAEPDLTERDVAAANAKVRMAYADLSGLWRARFTEIGERFITPRLLRYRGPTRSACGVLQPNNAAYCPIENAIYYDEVFVAAQAKAAARELGTDGDMAGIGVIAHEMGHAVAIQLGYASPVAYDNEAIADCLAGAFARHADENGSLETGDVEEAFFGMAAAADPTPELTGNRRIDRRILRQVALMGHGTREQRMGNFRSGLSGGTAACFG